MGFAHLYKEWPLWTISSIIPSTHSGGCIQGTLLQDTNLSRTTVYNTLRMLSEKQAAQMITIDDHRICYDGNTTPHVHFFCNSCGKVIDFFDESAPQVEKPINIGGNIVTEKQLYYKGICKECLAKTEKQAH